MGPYKPISNKLIIESAIEAVNEQSRALVEEQRKEDLERKKLYRENEALTTAILNKRVSSNRFNSFSESVTHALMSECLYYVYAKSMRESLIEQPNIKTMMHAMVSSFIHEDAAEILYNMRTKTAVLSEMFNLITSTKKKILESVDKNDPSTFTIGKDDKEEFFSKLDKMDTDSVADSIRDRVVAAVDDFVQSNKEDHDKILDALQRTKDKIEEVKDEPEEVQEAFTHMSKRFIGKIRNRKKGVFESMVLAMSESVMKDPQLNEEFTEGAKLNVPKIVDRIETMYTFIECVNTMKLAKVDEAYIQSVIENLRTGR